MRYFHCVCLTPEPRTTKSDILPSSGRVRFFIETAERLSQWVEERNVPAENNRAERELRPTVIARKVSFGSQAEEGAKTRGVLLSVMQTLNKREVHPRQKFKQVLDKISENPNLKVTSLLFETDSS